LLASVKRGRTWVQIEVPAHTAPRTSLIVKAADDWLTPDQATHLLKKPRHWLVRHHQELPFARKVSRKTILFNRLGALRWLETRPR